MSAENRSRRLVGIETRVDRAGRTQYRGQAYDRRARKPLRGPWTHDAAEARTWRADAMSRLAAGLLSADRGALLADAAEAWVAAARSSAIRNRSGDPYKPSAVRGYEQAFRLRIQPAFGDARLGDLRAPDVQRFVARLQERGHSASTIRNTINALRALYRHALAHGDAYLNPTAGVQLPAVRGRRERIAGVAEAERLLAALPLPERAIWGAAFFAGMRHGEIRALDWQAVDLAAGTIAVADGWDHIEGRIEPKSMAGARTVPLIGRLRALLAEQRLASGRAGGLVFGRTATEPFSPSAAIARADQAWAAANDRVLERAVREGRKPAADELLVRIGQHEARHTFASYLIAAGVDLKAISAYMGHSSVAFTIDRYGHLLPGSHATNAAKLDAFLDDASGG